MSSAQDSAPPLRADADNQTASDLLPSLFPPGPRQPAMDEDMHANKAAIEGERGVEAHENPPGDQEAAFWDNLLKNKAVKAPAPDPNAAQSRSLKEKVTGQLPSQRGRGRDTQSRGGGPRSKQPQASTSSKTGKSQCLLFDNGTVFVPPSASLSVYNLWIWFDRQYLLTAWESGSFHTVGKRLTSQRQTWKFLMEWDRLRSNTEIWPFDL